MAARSGRRAGGVLRNPWLSRHVLLAGGFILFSGLLVFLTLKLFAPFVKGLLWASVIAILAYPLHRLMLRLTGRRRGLSSVLATALITLGGLVPSVALLTVLADETRAAYRGLIGFLKSDRYQEVVGWLASRPGEWFSTSFDLDIGEQLGLWSEDAGTATLNAAADFLGHTLRTAMGNLPMLAVNVVVIFVAVFYFLRDGEVWLRRFKDVLPLEPRVRDLVTTQFTATVWAVMHGIVLTALIQAVILSAGLWLFGVPLPVFFGMIGFFASLLPVVGPTVVWIPASAWLYFTDAGTARALGLFAYGALLVSSIDTFLRPYIIGERMRLPFLVLILAMLGGLMAYGALGLFLGPVLVAVAMGVARVYREMNLARSRRS